jgi:hypothetical protein
MKVLEAGKRGLEWTVQHRCTGWGNGGNGCEALLEVDKADLRYVEPIYAESWGGRDAAVNFKCPVCATVTDLGMNDWPKDYRNLTLWTKAWHDSMPEIAA